MYEPETAPLSDYLREPGLKLATLDGVDYYRLDLVIARPVEGAGSRPYCLLRDWEQTAVGRISQQELIMQMQQERIAAQQREMTDLVQFYRAEIAKLTTVVQVAQHTPTQPTAPEIPKAAPVEQTKQLKNTPATEPVVCKRCGVLKPVIDFPQAPGVTVPTRQGRVCKACISDANKRRQHDESTGLDALAFTCPQCKSQAFTQALHRDVCVRCARTSIVSTGVSIAAAE